MSRIQEYQDETHAKDRERNRIAYRKKRDREDAEIAAGLRPPRGKRTGRPRTRTDEDIRRQRREATANYRERHPEKIRASFEARRQAARDFYYAAKKGPCVDCTHSFHPVCMDFDHRDGEVKVRDVAKMVALGISVEKIAAEIAKCDLVCANCHRLRTHERNGWYDHE